MEKKNEHNPYLKTIFGTAGILLVIIGMVKYILLYDNTTDAFMLGLGFFIMLHYIYSLEKKAGIYSKVTLWRSTLFTLTLLLSVVFFQ